MTVQEGLVDGKQACRSRQTNEEGGKVPLKSWIDLVGAGRWVHTCHHLRIHNVLDGHLV